MLEEETPAIRRAGPCSGGRLARGRGARSGEAARLCGDHRPVAGAQTAHGGDDRVRHAPGLGGRLQRRPPIGSDQARSAFPTSLALLDFLARRGVFADLVLGVKLNPFGAHSWVQTGPVVLNDAVDHVNAHTPILVV